MRMTPQIKERFEITGWSVAIALLSVCVYFLVRINNKIDYTYDMVVIQKEINLNVQEKFNRHSQEHEKINHEIKVLDTRQDIVSERLYSLEALEKYRPVPILNKN